MPQIEIPGNFSGEKRKKRFYPVCEGAARASSRLCGFSGRAASADLGEISEDLAEISAGY